MSTSNQQGMPMMVAAAIEIPVPKLEGFCRRHHVRRMSLFGSVLGTSFHDHSDVDILVDFAPGHVPGLAFIDMQDELAELFGGRRIDLITEKFLNRRIRQSVLDSAVVIYEE
ncbi:MAG TPA: nucleotidyltransferase domain-containing protein [Phycisphaerae bacterium]|jgi:predicted nucleotidyltransferase|nr:nucleotidyltransferase domain-containing protein [Phycisphaerae bacterium]